MDLASATTAASLGGNLNYHICCVCNIWRACAWPQTEPVHIKQGPRGPGILRSLRRDARSLTDPSPGRARYTACFSGPARWHAWLISPCRPPRSLRRDSRSRTDPAPGRALCTADISGHARWRSWPRSPCPLWRSLRRSPAFAWGLSVSPRKKTGGPQIFAGKEPNKPAICFWRAAGTARPTRNSRPEKKTMQDLIFFPDWHQIRTES